MTFNDRIAAECPVCKRTFKTDKGRGRHENQSKCRDKVAVIRGQVSIFDDLESTKPINDRRIIDG